MAGAYTVDKEHLGPDAPEVGQHLIGLGTAYHQQGKLEAAALTLEEARSILVYALGDRDEQVQLVKEKIKKLSVIEFDFNANQAQQPSSQVRADPLTNPMGPPPSPSTLTLPPYMMTRGRPRTLPRAWRRGCSKRSSSRSN